MITRADGCSNGHGERSWAGGLAWPGGYAIKAEQQARPKNKEEETHSPFQIGILTKLSFCHSTCNDSFASTDVLVAYVFAGAIVDLGVAILVDVQG